MSLASVCCKNCPFHIHIASAQALFTVDNECSILGNMEYTISLHNLHIHILFMITVFHPNVLFVSTHYSL